MLGIRDCRVFFCSSVGKKTYARSGNRYSSAPCLRVGSSRKLGLAVPRPKPGDSVARHLRFGGDKPGAVGLSQIYSRLLQGRNRRYWVLFRYYSNSRLVFPSFHCDDDERVIVKQGKPLGSDCFWDPHHWVVVWFWVRSLAIF